jgi:hypothetical protein
MASVAPEISTSVRTNKFSNYSIYSVSNELNQALASIKPKSCRIDNISLSIFHQNIGGVRSKLDELVSPIIQSTSIIMPDRTSVNSDGNSVTEYRKLPIRLILL